MFELSKKTKEFLSKNRSKKMVFTNGCFDILHSGHIMYLNEAKALGDFLIVGLNSDSSIKQLKGSDRPINNEEDRKYLLENLRAVDCVEIFSQDTPYELIKAIGSDIVLKKGGEVKSLSFKEGKSTTKLIEKIRKNT